MQARKRQRRSISSFKGTQKFKGPCLQVLLIPLFILSSCSSLNHYDDKDSKFCIVSSGKARGEFQKRKGVFAYEVILNKEKLSLFIDVPLRGEEFLEIERLQNGKIKLNGSIMSQITGLKDRHSITKFLITYYQLAIGEKKFRREKNSLVYNYHFNKKNYEITLHGERPGAHGFFEKMTMTLSKVNDLPGRSFSLGPVSFFHQSCGKKF